MHVSFYNSEKNHSCIPLSQLNATEQVLSSFTEEEFEVYQTLVKAERFSLMRMPKVTFKCTSRGKPHEGLSLIKLWVIENACFSKLN